MNRVIYILPLLLLFLISLPQHVVDQIRSNAVGMIPVKRSVEVDEWKTLQLENHQLRAQLDRVYEWIGAEKRLREQMEAFREFGLDKKVPKDFHARRSQEMRDLLQRQAMAAVGKVIYRDPTSWSSSCWIDVGEENNSALGMVVIAKNSPVVSGSCLVGIVEYVGRKQSRVRLITDSGLKTAVRVIRGAIADREIVGLAHELLDRLKRYPGDPLQEHLERLSYGWQDIYLAKGELSGSSSPYFRSLHSTLKGVGFNCDFGDVEGTAKDLRSGILQVGDVLVTSGLDGVLPPGLRVGIVEKVESLAMGAFAYELEAKPAAKDLMDLSVVSVLPPVSID